MQGPVSRKSRELFGRISGVILHVLFVSSKRMRLGVRNFAVILIVILFTTYEKEKLYRISGSEIYECLFGREKFSGLSGNGP